MHSFHPGSSCDQLILALLPVAVIGSRNRIESQLKSVNRLTNRNPLVGPEVLGPQQMTVAEGLVPFKR